MWAVAAAKTGHGRAGRTAPVSAPQCCVPLAPPALDISATAKTAELLRALGDPTRLGIVDLLARQSGPVCVCEIVEQFEQGQPTISHHLRVLRQAGLVDCTRRGTWAYYYVRPEALNALATALARLRP